MSTISDSELATASRSPSPLPSPPEAAHVIDSLFPGASRTIARSNPARDDTDRVSVRSAAPPYTPPNTADHPPTPLPPYAPPGHTIMQRDGMYYSEEPKTLARSLFVYGFLFPPFWIIGSTILFSDLEVPPNWEEAKTEDERKLLLESLRVTEIKWAKRCLFAWLSLLLIAALLFIVIRFAVIPSFH